MELLGRSFKFDNNCIKVHKTYNNICVRVSNFSKASGLGTIITIVRQQGILFIHSVLRRLVNKEVGLNITIYYLDYFQYLRIVLNQIFQFSAVLKRIVFIIIIII